MRKILISAVAGAALAVVPAMAAKPTTPNPNKPSTPAKCKTNTVGFHSKGTLTAAPTLTQVAGQGTTDTSDDRYDGSVSVNVKSANHGAPKGAQTYTFTGAKVKFYNDTNGQPVTTPAVGDTVHVFGKITKFRKKHCAPGSPEITVKRVSFTQAAPTS